MDPESSSKPIQLAALGRSFSLGTLYDCRQDSAISAFTLWDNEDLKNNIKTKLQHNTEFEIVASESIEDKASSLNVEGSLKASFLSGLVDVDGSAKYLQYSKTSQNQARVTLKYKATQRFEELSMNHLGRGNIKHQHVFDSGIQATHVVTGILYGAQAFFVFDRVMSDQESLKDIEVSLKTEITKIPSLEMGITGSLQRKGIDIANVEKLSCTFHGDFALKKNPVTFKDAIEVYQSLPELMGANGENAVPLKICLMPLTFLDCSCAQLVRQISTALVNEAQSVLEDFSELELRCNDALNSPAAQFPQISKKLKAFKYLCDEYKLEFRTTLGKHLPLIRGGGEEESVIAEVLKRRLSSPFNNKDLFEWMEHKEREMNIIHSLTNMMKNAKIVSGQNELDKIIFNPENQYVVCFAFTSLQTVEPYLSALSSYTPKETPKEVNTQDPALHTYDAEKEQWYFSKDVYQSMREKAKLLIDFSEANGDKKNIQFLTTSTTNESQKGASVYLYQDGFEVNDNFEPPSKPEKAEATDITHNSVTLKMHPPGFGAKYVSHYSIEYFFTGQDGCQQQTTSKADEVTVSKLSPNTEYKFRYRAVCPVGRGPASEVSDSMKTLPTSPPGKPQVEAYSNKLSVNWEKPTVLGDGVTVESYSVEYAKKSTGMKHEHLQWNKVTSKDKKTIISGLKPMTEYVVRVRCECGVAGRSKESIAVTVQTKEAPQRPGEFYKNRGNLVKSGSPSVYKLHLAINKMDIAGCKSYSFGKESVSQNRTIMVLGAIGAGKSTLVNGMINYILGVKWEDPFRYKLVHEGQTKSQAESQTSEITVYKIKHQEGFQIDYSLTIVDTPGFGDTREIDRDRLISEQLNKLFTDQHGVTNIDTVCFVVQASLAQLCHTQRYVFNTVLSIFGKDIEENIRVLVTFADSHPPPVLEKIKVSGVPCPTTSEGLPLHFKFNNSALFAANKSLGANNTGASGGDDEDDDKGSFDQMFWDMGIKSMKKFFTDVNLINTKSLTLTKEVV